MNTHQSADVQPTQVLLLGSWEPTHICGHGLWVGPGERSWAGSDLWAWDFRLSIPALIGFFTWWISWLLKSKCPTLLMSVVLGFSVQNPCVILVFCCLHLTGMSNPSPSFPDEIFFLCSRLFLPQYQTTSWYLTEKPSERSLSSRVHICVLIRFSVRQTPTKHYSTESWFVLLPPYLVIVLPNSQLLPHWLRCLPSHSSSSSIT